MDSFRLAAFILLLFIGMVYVSGDESMENTSKFSGSTSNKISAISCVMTCGVELQKTVGSFYGLGESGGMVGNKERSNSIQKLLKDPSGFAFPKQVEMLDKTCEAFDDFRYCIGDCPNADILRDMVLSKLAGPMTLCGAKKEDFKRAMPCLSKHRESIKKRCSKEEDRVAISSMFFRSESVVNNPTVLVSAVQEFCGAFLNHTTCMGGVHREVCGMEVEQLMQSLWFDWVSPLLTSNLQQLPMECKLLLTTLTPTAPPQPQTQIPRPPSGQELVFLRNAPLDQRVEPLPMPAPSSGSSMAGSIYLTLLLLFLIVVLANAYGYYCIGCLFFCIF